jgi:hypothetical protein
MRTTPFLGCLAVVLFAPASALGQDRTWEWQWGMHPMMFMWGASTVSQSAPKAQRSRHSLDNLGEGKESLLTVAGFGPSGGR